MSKRLVSLGRDRRVQDAGDALLAFLLAVTSVGSIFLRNDLSWGRQQPLAIALALLSTVPVAWRARRPLPSAAIVLFANGACAYAARPARGRLAAVRRVDARLLLAR